MPIGGGFLSAFLAKLRTGTYSKTGTSGAAVAKLTKQTIPEMEKTITAVAGDSVIIHCDCLLVVGDGNDLLLGELPYSHTGYAGGGTPATELDKITDGDNSTSTTTAITVYTGTTPPGVGYIDYDIGEIGDYTVYVKVGQWRVGGGTTYTRVYTSVDGVDWDYAGLIAQTTSTSESPGYINGVVEGCRYIRLIIGQSNAGVGYHKIYTFTVDKGNANNPPYLAMWPEVNGVEVLPEGREYDLLDIPRTFSITRTYTIPADGEYTIAMKWQELQRVVGEYPYESSYQIQENERMLILQHIKSMR